MLDNKKVMDQVNELLDRSRPDIIARAGRLLASGAVDPSRYEDHDYLLAKVLITVALRDEAYQWAPISDVGKKMIKNLEHF